MNISNEELIRLIQAGDEAKAADLLERNRGLIYKIMGEFSYLLKNEQNKEDLFQAGCLGFMKALRRYDFSFHTQFTTFAYRYIHGEIVRLADTIMNAEATYSDLCPAKDSDLLCEEVADYVHRTVSGEISPTSLETTVVNRVMVQTILDQVTPRQKKVLWYRYAKDWTQDHIGEELGIHQVDVSREEKRARTKLRILFEKKECGVY
ncbi:hypothetical protein ABB02_02050 [Clostridiaceae bacterium JG1575]|nr:hypothetical protein ABB02_02050 [Clostridiaceae bacterium JG1575]